MNFKKILATIAENNHSENRCCSGEYPVLSTEGKREPN